MAEDGPEAVGKDDPFEIKITLLGDRNCGKSGVFSCLTGKPCTFSCSHLLWYAIWRQKTADNLWMILFLSSDPNHSGIEIAFDFPELEERFSPLSFMLWHPGKRMEYRWLPRNCYASVAIFLVCFDLTNSKSFNSIDAWMEDMNRYDYPNKPAIVILGCKTDLVQQRSVTRAQGEAMARKYGASYNECSALNQEGCDTALISAICDIQAKINDGSYWKVPPTASVSLTTPPAAGNSGSSGGYCY